MSAENHLSSTDIAPSDLLSPNCRGPERCIAGVRAILGALENGVDPSQIKHRMAHCQEGPTIEGERCTRAKKCSHPAVLGEEMLSRHTFVLREFLEQNSL